MLRFMGIGNLSTRLLLGPKYALLRREFSRGGTGREPFPPSVAVNCL